MNLAERKVLNLLHGRKVTADEAADLIDAIRAQIDAPTKGRSLASSIVGRGEIHRQLHVDIAYAAALDGPVVVEGETGTGKMLISRTIHYNSRRADRHFLSLNCTSETVEEELFGVEPKKKGESIKRGLLDIARGGTIVLDMLVDLPQSTQQKLYTLLQTGQFTRVGGSKSYTSDTRIIGVCHGRLSDQVDIGQFNTDLFQALTVTKICAPALRDCHESIPDMVTHYVAAQSHTDSRVPPGVSDDLIKKLNAYTWPENHRELHQAIKEALVGFKGDVLKAEDVEVG